MTPPISEIIKPIYFTIEKHLSLLISRLQDSLRVDVLTFSGVLLYGPPGCGKTLIAKIIARAANARFINLQVSSLCDKWYGESQKLADAVFSVVSLLFMSSSFLQLIITVQW